MKHFELRWAQLDVARQMESVGFIKDFISLLADSGYNGLLLYLEDRIKTRSYHEDVMNHFWEIDNKPVEDTLFWEETGIDLSKYK